MVPVRYEYRIVGEFGVWGDGFESHCADPNDDEWAEWFLKDFAYAATTQADEPGHFHIQRRELGEWEDLS